MHCLCIAVCTYYVLLTFWLYTSLSQLYFKLSLKQGPCGGGKRIFSTVPGSWLRPIYNTQHVNKRKTNRSLIIYIPAPRKTE